jgi:hypothetical protein
MNHDTNRIVWLFDKPYWWEYGPYGQLALRPAPWEEAENDTRVKVDVRPAGSPAQIGDQVARAIRRWRRDAS